MSRIDARRRFWWAPSCSLLMCSFFSFIAYFHTDRNCTNSKFISSEDTPIFIFYQSVTHWKETIGQFLSQLVPGARRPGDSGFHFEAVESFAVVVQGEAGWRVTWYWTEDPQRFGRGLLVGGKEAFTGEGDRCSVNHHSRDVAWLCLDDSVRKETLFSSSFFSSLCLWLGMLFPDDTSLLSSNYTLGEGGFRSSPGSPNTTHYLAYQGKY